LAWTIEYTETARQQLRKLDKQTARRILSFIDDRVAKADNQRELGKALTGETLGVLWRYCVGDFRIICDIQDEKLCVLMVRVGNRREVYR
jgi:mRNA interferase RelE/StbE